MSTETKICGFCRHENFRDNSRCVHCGRFFPAGVPGGKGPSVTSSAGHSIDPRYFILFPSGILLISLFLPWLSYFVVRLNAFDIAGFLNIAARMAGRSTLSMTLIRILIYTIPAGCILIAFRSLTGRTVKAAGIWTGTLPLLVFFLLMIQPAGILRMISIGFIIAILSGISIIVISVRE